MVAVVKPTGGVQTAGKPQKDEKNYKQHFGNAGCSPGNAPETKHGCDQSHYQESDCPT